MFGTPACSGCLAARSGQEQAEAARRADSLATGRGRRIYGGPSATFGALARGNLSTEGCETFRAFPGPSSCIFGPVHSRMGVTEVARGTACSWLLWDYRGFTLNPSRYHGGSFKTPRIGLLFLAMVSFIVETTLIFGETEIRETRDS